MHSLVLGPTGSDTIRAETTDGKDKTTETLLKTVLTADNTFDQGNCPLSMLIRSCLTWYAVRGTAEAVIDSQIMRSVTEKASKNARAMKSGSGAFDVDEFLQKLVTFMGGRNAQHIQEDDEDEEQEEMAPSESISLDWERIGRKALAHSHRIPVSDFM